MAAAGFLLVAMMAAIPAKAHASPSITCFGSVACAGGNPVTAGCTGDEVLVQDQQVPGLGDIDLYESGTCDSAWAVLHVSSSALITNQSNFLYWPYLAEIFYEPPAGGSEQFNTVQWDGNLVDNATSAMVPLSGSVKACGGDPGDSTDPFDEDPQAIDGVTQDPTPNPNDPSAPSSGGGDNEYTAGACTIWH